MNLVVIDIDSLLLLSLQISLDVFIETKSLYNRVCLQSCFWLLGLLCFALWCSKYFYYNNKYISWPGQSDNMTDIVLIQTSTNVLSSQILLLYFSRILGQGLLLLLLLLLLCWESFWPLIAAQIHSVTFVWIMTRKTTPSLSFLNQFLVELLSSAKL